MAMAKGIPASRFRH